MQATKLSESTNPKTGEPFGEDFLTQGELDLVDLYGYCTQAADFGCYRAPGDIPPIASTRLHTTDKFAFRYGRAEISAKMPVGDWLWPAMWLLPQNWRYGGWPLSGEIDIVELIGNRDYKCSGNARDINHMGSTLHWGPSPGENMWPLTTGERYNFDQNFGDFFHTYVLEWDPQELKVSVDDVVVMSTPNPAIQDRTPDNCWTGYFDFAFPNGGPVNPWTDELVCDGFMAPFDQSFYLILNVAVGGRWYIPDNCVNAGGDPSRRKPWGNGGGQSQMMWDFYNNQDGWYPSWTSEGDNNALQVDWIRVYQREGGYAPTVVPDGCPTPAGGNCA